LHFIGDHLRWLATPTGNLFVIFFGFAWLFAVAFWPSRTQRIVEAKDVAIDAKNSPPPTETKAAAPSWWDEMVADDAKKIKERLVVIQIEPQPHFTAIEPYIEFKLTFVNATVFSFILEKIEGETYFQRSPLAQHPNIVDPPFTLRHGATGVMTIRQCLSKELAQTLASARGHVKLDFSRICFSFFVISASVDAPKKFFWFGSDDVTVANRD